MKAIILAGGFGARLQTVTGEDTPKPMVLIAGKPFLEHQINLLKQYGIKEIILAVHYHANKIKSYFEDGRKFGIDITYSEEESPLGTAGAIKKAERYIEDTFLVMNGDSYSQIDLSKFLDFHKAKRSIATLSLTSSLNFEQFGNAILDGERISRFVEKIGTENQETFGSSGVYVFEPQIFEFIEPEKKVSLEIDIFPKLTEQKILWGFRYEGYFMDIGRPETYNQFKKDVLKSLFVGPKNSLSDIINKFNRSGIGMALVVDKENKLMGLITENISKDHLLRGGNVNDPIDAIMDKNPITANINDNSSRITKLLMSGVNHVPLLDNKGSVQAIEFSGEPIKTQNYPTVRGRTPLRISFSGGGTDLPYFFEKNGGVVINATIDKYCHATIVKRADKKIVLNSDLDIEKKIFIRSLDDLEYDGNFDLVKATIKVMDIDFGLEIYLHNDMPPGRGLGSSASFVVLLISLISQLKGAEYDDYRIAKLAHKVEREELKIKGGWQDQYSAAIGGFNFMEFGKDKAIIYPLRLKEEAVNEFNEHLLLCYVGSGHDSGKIHESQEEKYAKNEEEITKTLNESKEIAVEIKDRLLTNDIRQIGKLLHASWQKKRELSAVTTNKKIDFLYSLGLKNGASGGKILGAGGGGYLLFFVSPQKRNKLKRAIKEEGMETLDFRFVSEGTKIWTVKNAA